MRRRTGAEYSVGRFVVAVGEGFSGGWAPRGAFDLLACSRWLLGSYGLKALLKVLVGPGALAVGVTAVLVAQTVATYIPAGPAVVSVR